MENGWIDDEGRVYIIFTLTTIRQAMNCAEKSAIKYLTELEEFGLIERIRQGFGKPEMCIRDRNKGGTDYVQSNSSIKSKRWSR